MRAPVSGQAGDKASGGFAVLEWLAGEIPLPAWRMNELCAGRERERKGRDLPPASRSPRGGTRFGALSLGPVTFCAGSAPALLTEGGEESELRATVCSGQVGFFKLVSFGERCPFCGDRSGSLDALYRTSQAGFSCMATALRSPDHLHPGNSPLA